MPTGYAARIVADRRLVCWWPDPLPVFVVKGLGLNRSFPIDAGLPILPSFQDTTLQ